MKLYYTDARIASLMLSEHNIYMYIGNFEPGDYDTYKPSMATMIIEDFIFQVKNEDNFKNWDKKIYIHPDSHHIFKPMVGDLVIERGRIRQQDRIGTIKNITKDKQLSVVADYHDDEDYKGKLVHNIFHKKAEIIQRQGKPFFMPKSEAVKGIKNDR